MGASNEPFNLAQVFSSFDPVTLAVILAGLGSLIVEIAKVRKGIEVNDVCYVSLILLPVWIIAACGLGAVIGLLAPETYSAIFSFISGLSWRKVVEDLPHKAKRFLKAFIDSFLGE